eukprot:Gb_36865 [translate_table: standard]
MDERSIYRHYTQVPWNPWDRRPIFTSRPRLSSTSKLQRRDGDFHRIQINFQRAELGGLEEWRHGSFRHSTRDEELARSRLNAVMSARLYLEQEERTYDYSFGRPQFSHPYGHQVRYSRTHRTSGEQEFGSMLRGERRYGLKRPREDDQEIMQRNQRRRGVGLAYSLTNSPNPFVKQAARRFNRYQFERTASLNDDDDELEEGSPSLSSTKQNMEENMNEFQSQTYDPKRISPMKSMEPSWALDVTPRRTKTTHKFQSKFRSPNGEQRTLHLKKKKNPPQIKKIKNQSYVSPQASHIIVVRGQENSSKSPSISVAQPSEGEGEFFCKETRNALLGNVGGGDELNLKENDEQEIKSKPSKGDSGSHCAAEYISNAVRGRTKSVSRCQDFGGSEASDCLGKVNWNSMLGNLGSPAIDKFKPEPEPQEDIMNEIESAVPSKEVKFAQNGPELLEQPLEGEQSASISEVSELCKLQQKPAHQDVRSSADLSVFVEPTVMAVQEVVHLVDINHQNSVNCEGYIQCCSTTAQEVEEQSHTERLEYQGLFLQVGIADMTSEIRSAISLQEKLRMPRNGSILQCSGMKKFQHSEVPDAQTNLPLHKHFSSNSKENEKPLDLANPVVPLSMVLNLGLERLGVSACETNRETGVTDQYRIYPSDVQEDDVGFPSGNKAAAFGASLNIASLQKHKSRINECSLQLLDGGKWSEIGKPCFTEATAVSSLVMSNIGMANYIVQLDRPAASSDTTQLKGRPLTAELDSTIAKLEHKQLDATSLTSDSDSSTANLESKQLDEKSAASSFMASTVVPPNLTLLQEVSLHRACLESSRTYPLAPLNVKERPLKKLRSEQTANVGTAIMSSLVSQSGFDISELHESVAMEQTCQTLTSRPDVTKQSALIFQTQGLHPDSKSSQNTIKTPLPPKSSTTHPKTWPQKTGGSVCIVGAHTCNWSDTSVKLAAAVVNPPMVLNIVSPSGQAPIKVARSEPPAYIRKGNSLVRALGPPMGCLASFQSYSAPPRRNQVYPPKYSCMRKLAKLAPATLTRVGSSKLGGFVPPAERPKILTPNMKLQVISTGSPQSSPDTMTKIIPSGIQVVPSRLPGIGPVDANKEDLLREVNTCVGSPTISMPPNCLSLLENNQREVSTVQVSTLHSRTGPASYVKIKSNQLFAARASRPQASTAFTSKSCQLWVASPVQDCYYKRKNNQLLRSNKLVDMKLPRSVKGSAESSLSDISKELDVSVLKTHRSSTVYQTRLGREFIMNYGVVMVRVSSLELAFLDYPSLNCNICPALEDLTKFTKGQQGQLKWVSPVDYRKVSLVYVALFAPSDCQEVLFLKQEQRATLQSSWSLNDAPSLSSSLSLSQAKRVVPLLFHWKRPAYVVTHSGRIKSVPQVNKGSSLFLISKKLQCLRKRQTVYSRSVDGFSLHRLAVFSLGGSNLKWTKSIDKWSKKANEEATKAVAAVEKKKREEKRYVAGDATTDAKAKSDRLAADKDSRGLKLSPCEHIVYVGFRRYKMDPSKQMLHIIPDGGPHCNSASSSVRHTDDTVGISTPKRLSVGGSE